MPRCTLYGWYQYDETILNGIRVPENVQITTTDKDGDHVKTIEGINKNDLITLMIMKMGDLYTYYQEPNHLKDMIWTFFRTRYRDYERILQSYFSEYNPLDNVFEYASDTKKDNFKDTTTRTGNTETTNTGGSTTENKTSAYDSTAYSPESQQTFNYNSGGMKTKTDFNNVKDVMERTTVDQSEVHFRHGNVGVTSSQQMINQELELRRNNLYNYIIEEFAKEFIVRVY